MKRNLSSAEGAFGYHPELGGYSDLDNHLLGYFAPMKTPASIAIILVAVVLNGCRSPHDSRKATVSEQSAVVLPVLADMVVKADNTGKLIRFVELHEPVIGKLRELCGPQFQIRSFDEADRSTGTLCLKGTNHEGVHLAVDIVRLRGQEAQVRGTYLHVGSFAFFDYNLRFAEGAWHVLSCEFVGAS